MPANIRTSIFLFGIAGLALFVASRLPYRTAEIVRVDNASERPAADGAFRVGDLVWDTPRFAQDPSFEPMRSFFREHCPGLRGGPAAMCISDVFARTFPKGTPRSELFDPTYDPVADLSAHRGGEPGHCVTRSGLMSATLLSVGIPAKVVQLLGAGGAGHTVMSVWDEVRGWVIYDPSFGVYVTVDGQPRSATHLVAGSESLAPVAAGLTPGGVDERGVLFYDTLRGPGLTILVPEPWLYMRAGAHHAHAPLRGRFALVGEGKWTIGPAQDALRLTFLGSTLLALASLVASRLRKRAAVTADPVPPQAIEAADARDAAE